MEAHITEDSVVQTTGRVTLPIEEGLGAELVNIIHSSGADAVRNSDGTTLPEDANDLGVDVYATYFPARGDQEWAVAHPQARSQVFCLSDRIPCLKDEPLIIDVMASYYAEQIEPNTDCDLAKYWQVIDRTTQKTLPFHEWDIVEGTASHVRIHRPHIGHVYTVTFLAYQCWDSTQMYNYITNHWENDPGRVKEIPYDIRNPYAWERALTRFKEWLIDHPNIDVVRFTTFFYHFTLLFNNKKTEKYVDWFGYTASVSPRAIEAFENETGYTCQPEDFVHDGTFSSPFLPPSPLMRAWIRFQHKFVTDHVRTLVNLAHEYGKRTLMFLGDTWIGTEPYGPYWKHTDLDGVVGSVGNAVTCRMISDIPHVDIHEGRLLPYFFPDEFYPGGHPIRSLRDAWVAARRAIIRKPLDRIGFGGYLSLALHAPHFMDRLYELCQEFRDIYAIVGKTLPKVAPFTVGVLTQWGTLRTWQNHMVAHALHYDMTSPYVGVLEALAGLPVDVRFISFDDVEKGILDDLDVIINTGSSEDAFSGGNIWENPHLQVRIRSFIASGGGIIGIGDPTATPGKGTTFQLSDVFGIDKERGVTLSHDRYAHFPVSHFVTSDNFALHPDEFDAHAGYSVAIDENVDVLCGQAHHIALATHTYGCGRAVYFSGLPYSAQNARLLLRALFWASRNEKYWDCVGVADDPYVDIAAVENRKKLVVCNAHPHHVTTTISYDGTVGDISLQAGETRIISWPQHPSA